MPLFEKSIVLDQFIKNNIVPKNVDTLKISYERISEMISESYGALFSPTTKALVSHKTLENYRRNFR